MSTCCFRVDSSKSACGKKGKFYIDEGILLLSIEQNEKFMQLRQRSLRHMRSSAHQERRKVCQHHSNNIKREHVCVYPGHIGSCTYVRAISKRCMPVIEADYPDLKELFHTPGTWCDTCRYRFDKDPTRTSHPLYVPKRHKKKQAILVKTRSNEVFKLEGAT